MAEYMGHTVSSVYTVSERAIGDTGSRITQAAGPLRGVYNSTISEKLANQRNASAGNHLKLTSDINYESSLVGLHPAPYGSSTVSLTPADWLAACHAERLTADAARSESELVRADAATLCLYACSKTHKAQEESTKKLEDRVGDIKFWRDQLKSEAELAARQSKSLKDSIGCLQKALVETKTPLDVAEQCLKYRQQRNGVDLTDDGVHVELLEEIANLRRVQHEMQHMLEAAQRQLSSGESSTAELENAIVLKNTALTLDSTAEKIGNASRGLQYFNGIERIDNTRSNPETWTDQADDLMKKSMKSRSSSKEFREHICQLLADCAASLYRQWNTVNIKFSDRIQEYLEAKNKLEIHLSKVQQEMFELERAMELLRRCIKDKEAPLKVAQTRLATRLERPGIEACQDLAKLRLTEEIHGINETEEQLRAKLAESEQNMNRLARVRMSLEVDLSVKNNSIQIDRELCMGLRKSHDMTPRVCASCTSSS